MILTSKTFLLLPILPILVACGGGSASQATPVSPTLAPAPTSMSSAAALGEKIFSDPSLSASGKQSCATCHDPAHAHAQSNALAVQLGGANLNVPGFRAVPSLRYLNLTPAFAIDKDGAASGGFNRDGRAASLAEQAERPFLAAHEMANASRADMVARLQRTAYSEQFRAVFGAHIFDDPDAAFQRATFALQQYQLEAPEFHPYDAKYDQFLAGKVALTPAELRGLALFNNTAKGNCIACHPSNKGSDGKPPLFTDFSFDAFGVPRNPRIAANQDPDYRDLGLCKSERAGVSDALCGQFKVPTLRNVATRKVFFHNGQFTSLRDVLHFYVQRDTAPERWYPVGSDGKAIKFNDLSPELRFNVNTSEVPYNRQPGMAPALSDAEIEDLLQFLNTLTDGYRP